MIKPSEMWKSQPALAMGDPQSCLVLFSSNLNGLSPSDDNKKDEPTNLLKTILTPSNASSDEIKPLLLEPDLEPLEFPEEEQENQENNPDSNEE